MSRSVTLEPEQAPMISGLSVWVDGRPVSVNAMYGALPRGGRYLRSDARAWRDLVWLAFRMQPHRFRPEQLPLRVHCVFHGVRGDADNYLKLTLDGLKCALDVDDRCFSPVTAEVVRSRSDGQGARIEVCAYARETGGETCPAG
jgi:Holliday junction resolvase RusA-like endonuclease